MHCERIGNYYTTSQSPRFYKKDGLDSNQQHNRDPSRSAIPETRFSQLPTFLIFPELTIYTGIAHLELGASGWISSYQRLRGVLYLCIIPLYHTRITRRQFILIPSSTRSIAFVSTWSHPCFPLIPTSQCQTTILRQWTRVGFGGEATTWHEDRPDVSPNYLEVSRKSLPSGYILPFCCEKKGSSI